MWLSVTLMASFTVPERVGTNPWSMLWLLPLVAALTVVYKATKLPKITTKTFIKETVILFGSIVAFMVVAALALCILAWLITE